MTDVIVKDLGKSNGNHDKENTNIDIKDHNPTMSNEDNKIEVSPNNTEKSGVTEQEGGNSESRSLTILMIDDDEFCIRTMEMIIKETNHKFIKAVGGIAGLKYLNENPKEVDLILLDLMMPDIYGLDVLREIKQSPQISHIPVVIQSANRDLEEINRAYKLGIIANLHKPYNSKRVFAAIEKVSNLLKVQKITN